MQNTTSTVSGLQFSRIFLAVFSALALSACAGGGGGGGGVRPDTGTPTPTTPAPDNSSPTPAPTPTPEPTPAPAPTTLNPSDFQTGEYSYGSFLQKINASEAYASNGTTAVSGAGITVAVIDTGLDTAHPDFAGRIASGGKMFASNGDPNTVVDLTGHGTHVAGIIAGAKDGTGMHGVAYGANVLPIGLGSNSMGDAEYAAVFDLARSKGARVLNNSWVMDLDIGSFATEAALEEFMPATALALRNVVATNGAVVFAAGNDSMAKPQFWARLPEKFDELRGSWLAVVATDSTGALASYSNACGSSMTNEWCLAAPGGDGLDPVVSTANGGGYGGMMGTSMAAPVVAGSLAVLMEKFPTLTTAQIVERVLHTANKTGIYADQQTYGQGMLDLGAAASPVNGLFVPTSASTTGSVAPLASLTINAPAGQVGAMKAALAGEVVLAVDGYQRAPFQLEAASFVVGDQTRGDTLEQKVARRAGRVNVAGQAGLIGYQQLDSNEMLVSMSFAGSNRLAFASDTTFGALTQAFSALKLTPSGAQELLLSRDRLDAATERTVGMGFSRNLGQGWDASMTAFAGQSDGGQHAVGAQLTRNWDTSALSLAVTQHTQNASKLAGIGAGLAVAGAQHEAGNTSVKGSMAWQPVSNWEVFSQLEVKLEQAASRASSNFALQRDATRTQMTLGASHVLADSGLTLSALYRVEPSTRTNLTVTLPNWVAADGSVTRKTVKLGYSDAAVHATGLYLEGAVDKKRQNHVSLGFSVNSNSQTEATATWRRAF